MKYLLLVIMPLAFFSCQKGISEEENPTTNIQCDLLRQGMITNSILMISESLGPTLDNQYSNDNLNQIARDISASCDMAATLTCYNCVKTVPPQSQLQCSFIQDNGEHATFTINLSAGRNNKIEIVSVEQ